MALETISAVLGVGGSVCKLVNLGFKLSAAEEDMAATSTILTLISDTAESVRLSRDQLISHLSPTQKRRIQTALIRADQLLDVSNRVLNKRYTISATGEVGTLRFSDRLVWVFRDKATVISYQNVLGFLHGTLLTICIELEILKNMRIGARLGLLNIVDMNVVYTQHPTSTIVTALTTYVATAHVTEDGASRSPESRVAVMGGFGGAYAGEASTEGEFEDTQSEAAETEVKFSITMDLKKRFTYRAMRAQTTSPPQSIAGDLKWRFSDRVERAGGFVENFVDINI